MRAYGVMVSAVLTAFWSSDAYAQAGGQSPQPQPTAPAPPTSSYPAPAPQPTPAPPAPPPPYAPGAQPGAPPAATQPGYPQDPQGAPPPVYPQPGYAPPQAGYPEQPASATYDEPSSYEEESQPAWRANQPGLVLGAERLTGFYYWNLKPDSGTDLSGTTLHVLFTGQNVYSIGVSAPSPRLSLDGVVGSGVTIGGSLGFASNTLEDSNDDLTISTFLISPRVGYIASLSESISLWPRLGIAYAIQTFSQDTTDASVHTLALTMDPMLVIHPVPRVGILVGPVFEISLIGTIESDTSSASSDFSTLTAGLAAGVAIFF